MMLATPVVLKDLENLKGDDKLRYDNDIKAVNILLLGLPVDIYTRAGYWGVRQLYAFLKHNERDDKEVREIRQRFPEPLDLLANTYNPPPSYSSEGHMAKHCTARKRVKDSEWFKDKMLLAQAQEGDSITNTIFMENLSPVGSLNDDTVAPNYDSYTLSEVPHYETYHDSDVLNFNIQELEYIENIVFTNESYDELKGLLKIETEPINVYFKNNRVECHHDYLKVTKEHVAEKSTDYRRKPELKTFNEHIDCNANVKNVALSKNSHTICLSCNECLFSANHDACVVKYLKKMQKLPLGNRLHTIRILDVAPNAETRMRYSIAKNSLIRAHINRYGHPFNPPNFSFVINSAILEQSSWNFGSLGIVEIVLWYLDFECSKHMTGRRDQFINFVSKFIGTVRFGNDHFAAIKGYVDLQMGNILISRVYYVEGLDHNLFSVGQFYDLDLEVAFRKHTCFVRNLEGVDLLSSSRGSNLYTISIADMIKSFPICLLSKTSKTKSWLWHRRFSHLNFGTINKLAKQGLVKGLPKLKYTKDYLCLACQMGKSKKESYPHKPEPSTNEKLQMLHMDLCGPMRFLRTKDEAPKIIIKFFKQAQVSLNATVRYSHTDNGIDFHNQTLRNYTEEVRITHMTSTTCTLQQNGVVERRNHTLVEAARIMLIFSKSLLFLWAKAIATTCYTQNCYLIHTRYNKTPYELLRDRKPELKYLHVFGALCYLTNDFEDLGKLQPKADIGIFIGLVLNQAASTSSKPPTKNDWDLLFQPMFDEYFKNPSTAFNPISVATLPPPDIVGVSSSSTSIDIDSLSPSTSPNNEATNSPLNSTNVEPNEEVAMFDSDTFTNLFALPDTSLIDSSLICVKTHIRFISK
ncbi:retrovirus-related pol polyprotein from transposon TNT 1-94 [Tanacetum coccineum]